MTNDEGINNIAGIFCFGNKQKHCHVFTQVKAFLVCLLSVFGVLTIWAIVAFATDELLFFPPSVEQAKNFMVVIMILNVLIYGIGILAAIIENRSLLLTFSCLLTIVSLISVVPWKVPLANLPSFVLHAIVISVAFLFSTMVKQKQEGDFIDYGF